MDNRKQQDSKLFTSKEAASWLNISTRKLWEVRNSGQIRHCRIGKKVLFSIEWLEEFVSQNTVGGQQFLFTAETEDTDETDSAVLVKGNHLES